MYHVTHPGLYDLYCYFSVPPTTAIYSYSHTLSLPAALPIKNGPHEIFRAQAVRQPVDQFGQRLAIAPSAANGVIRNVTGGWPQFRAETELARGRKSTRLNYSH